MDYALLPTLKQYLRRTYASDLVGLRRLADETFRDATETVTLTSLSAEGGSQSGQVSCPKGLLLQAIEEVLQELDPTIPTASRVGYMVMR